MQSKKLFWLHIKKSAGTSTVALLSPYYKKLKPKTFIQATPEEYNDILNNHSVLLGDFQFKRALFAKTFLFPENWHDLYSFAFSREPVDRSVSMFYYLYYRKKPILKTLYHAALNFKNHKKFGVSMSYKFDVFLDLVERAHFECESIYEPAGLHFSTHTAPMFGDISDMEGNILLSKVYRMEDLIPALNEVFEVCGIDKKISSEHSVILNKNKRRVTYHVTPLQKQKIMRLYKEDFEIYERAQHNIG